MTERCLHIATLGVVPGLPRVERVVEVVADNRYRCVVDGWNHAYAAVQIGLGGRGAIWPGAARSPGIGRFIPVDQGEALIFDTRRHRLAYATAPDAGEWRFLYLNLFGEAARAAIVGLVARHGHRVALGAKHVLVRELLARLPRDGEATAAWTAGESARTAMDLIAALVDAQSPRDGDDVVARAMVFLRERLGEDVGVGDAARACGVSREHLTRVFAARAGEAPARWLRRQRVALAQRLLEAGELSVAEVARRCGFAGPGHFIRLFRARTGRTPGRTRRAR